LLPDLARNNHGTFLVPASINYTSTEKGVAVETNSQAVEFNSTPINGTNDFSVVIWTKLSTTQSANDSLIPIFGQKAAVAASAGFMIYYWYGGADAGKWMHSTANGTASSEILTSATANTQGSFAHIVMRRSAAITNNGDFWINGIQYSLASSSTLRDVTTTTKLRISADASNLRKANQTVIEARVYSRLLTEPEIKLLASRPGIGLVPERRKTIQFQQQQFSPAWSRRQQLIGSGVY
jgi:hypothetical protein